MICDERLLIKISYEVFLQIFVYKRHIFIKVFLAYTLLVNMNIFYNIKSLKNNNSKSVNINT